MAVSLYQGPKRAGLAYGAISYISIYLMTLFYGA